MDLLSTVYLTYGAVSLALTAWLARTLHANGAIYLEHVFDDPRLAVSVNRLLVTGFYMLNLGWAFLQLEGGHAVTVSGAIEVFASKIGFLLFFLALFHFVNMFVFHRIRRRATARHATPPVAPSWPQATAMPGAAE